MQCTTRPKLWTTALEGQSRWLTSLSNRHSIIACHSNRPCQNQTKLPIRDGIIILIGPEGAGKSTIDRLLADALSKELYNLDRHRDEHYSPYNYDKSAAMKLFEEQGEWAF
ncbi:hypothetical protein BGZ63DRAFT_425499 [Mariannaea sp. PMI_226]|nr:hypothetical protein BGZ63DRAFT_425499 [Mariannaea sp. PMI_226]